MLTILRPKLELFFAMVQVMLSILHRHLHDVAQVSVYFYNTLDFIIHDLQELDAADTTPKSQQTVDDSLTSPSALNIQPRLKSIPDFLTRPLLNLTPHSDRDSDHEGTPSSSPKKKRRKRRKRKNTLIYSAADSKIDETSNMTSSVKW